MELPPWLKIENLVGSLNLSGWFMGWFKRENKQYVQTQINIGELEIYHNPILSPVSLTLEQEDLCRRLDEWYSNYNLALRPSELFRGSIFAARTECRSNPDWMAQAAHSLRDILYPFGDNGIPNKEEALKKYGSVRANQTFTGELGRIFGSLTELAHHGNGRGNSINFSTFTATDFERLLVEFERIMLDALTKQIDVHTEIDKLLRETPET